MHDFSFREAYVHTGMFAKATQVIEKLLQSRRCISQERNVISINEGGQMAGHASGCLDGNADVWRLGSQMCYLYVGNVLSLRCLDELHGCILRISDATVGLLIARRCYSIAANESLPSSATDVATGLRR